MMRKLWRALFERAKRDEELNAELKAHLEMEIDMRVGRGETPADAERNARLALGNVTNVAEATRESWSYSFFTGLGQDLTFAVRLMRKSPVFTLAAVASLALGIGANTAIFSVFSRTLRDPLAVSAPEDLFQLAFRTVETKPGSYISSFSYPLVKEISKESKTLEAVSCNTSSSASYLAGQTSRMLPIELVCGNLFQVLGLKASLGRLFTAEDNLKPGEHPLAVLSNHFWQSEFAGDPNVVGRTIELNRVKFTIIGVAPATYFSMSKGNVPSLFLPVVMDGALSGTPTDTTSGQSWWLRVVLRRKSGVSVEAMNSELTAILKREWERSERHDATEHAIKVANTAVVSVMSAAKGYDLSRRTAQYEKPFLMLMCVVGTVLLIACINIANLLLARATARQREIATRLAIGASRWRLVRQFLTESLVLSALGGAAGLCLALLLERFLVLEAFGKTALLTLSDGPSVQMLAMTVFITLLAGLSFGLAPALSADRQGIRSSHRLLGRKLMVSFQVALSVLLLSGAGLFLQTLENLRRIDSGFRRENLMTMTITPDTKGRSREALMAYYRTVSEKLLETPGVKDLSMSSIGMLMGSQWGSGIQVAGVVIPPGEPSPSRNAVGPRFFSVIGATFVEGRDFIEADNRPNAPKVAIVNQSFARRYFGSASAIGRKIGRSARTGMKDLPDYTIVGVVKDLRDARINEAMERYWYVPYEQQERVQAMNLNIRTVGNPTALMAAIRSAIASVDQYVPISREATMEMAVEDQIRQERLVARLSAFFAAVAMLLAIVGLYGVMSYAVERRTKEIGIRMALGESRGSVLWMFLRETSLFVGLGAIFGIPLSIALGQYAEKLLYGVKPVDWFSILIAVTAISLFGLMAGWISARRAASIQPMAALRAE